MTPPKLVQKTPGVRVHPVRRRFARHHHQTFRGPVQNTGLLKHPEQPMQQTLVLGDDLQRTTQLRRMHRGARLAPPAQSLQGRQRIAARESLQVIEESRHGARLDPLGREVLRDGFGALRNRGRRGQELRRTQAPRQRPLPPRHVEEKIVHPRDGRQQHRACRPLQNEVPNAADARSVHGVQPERRHPDIRHGFTARLREANMAQHPVRQRTRQP